MKYCSECRVFFEEQTMSCQRCQGGLSEVSLTDAFRLTDRQALERNIRGKAKKELPDLYKQYHIRCYIGNKSLFLDYDLHKYRLRHGRRLKRFFIAPVTFFSILNLPWFLFNLVATNLFHLTYTGYCERCDAKINPQDHTRAECDYNIEYFSVLDDILNGRILDRKPLYEQFAREKQLKGLRSAYHELFHRLVRWEIFWDVISIWFSVLFWLYVIVFISYPWVKVLWQMIQGWESRELLME